MNKKLKDALQFIVGNDGILVSLRPNGYYCECCENKNISIRSLIHDKDCIFNTLKNAAENMQLSLNFT